MNIWEIIFLFFSFQAFILAFFFFLKKKGDKAANVILGTYLLLFSFNIGYNVLYWSQLLFTEQYVHLFGWLLIFWLSYPPLIYLYTRRVVDGKKIGPKDIVHLIPIIIAVSLNAPFFVLSASEKMQILIDGALGNHILFIKYHFVGVIINMFFYVGLTLSVLRKNKLGYNKTRWLKWLLGAFSCYVVAMTTYFVLSRLNLITTGHDYFITYTLIMFIALVSYFGYVQPDVFDGLSMDEVLTFRKYKNTGLTENHSLELKGKLTYIMEAEKPYLNSNLRLDDLANKLNLSRHHTSQIINQHFDTNFFDFVNGYRIMESKSLLNDDNNLNITDVIFSSGFNNRVSFYKTFKKHTGVTPTEFRSR